MTNNYKVEITKLSESDGGGFLARAPELPGCMSDGETYEEAIENIQDAIKCWIETAQELGKSIPKASNYKDEDEFSGRLSLRIPKILHKQITDQSEKEGCSINQLIMMYISMGIGKEFGKNKVLIKLDTNYVDRDIVDELVSKRWDNNPSNKRFNASQLAIQQDRIEFEDSIF